MGHPTRVVSLNDLPGEGGGRADIEPEQGLVGGRYQLINRLGRGGMGTVFRAVDRYTGAIVTLKRLRVASSPMGTHDSRDDRLALAEEFRLLAALRHPNIVSVLTYGFDENHQPYFTMDLEEGARPITRAAANQPIALQIELLVQLLQALAYLHRHGIIHRDLKPDNILAVGNQVKVLDFGLSIYACDRDRAGAGGTLHYIAPEVLRDEPPTERCDLYSFGMIAYEILTGAYPFTSASPSALAAEIMTTTLPRMSDVIDGRIRPVLDRLLAKRPQERYGEASEVITALAQVLDLPLATETVVTRESFLQSAPLVGRDDQLAHLAALVGAAQSGHGGALLVAGESGVGKSRLLDEVRIKALVDGLHVVRGQAMRDGGPYHAWHEIVGHLMLRTDLPDADAAALKPIVPDLANLLDRDIEDAPGLEIDAAQLRLLVALEQLVHQQPGPCLIIVEDLQWAGSESLKVFHWLSQAAAELPVLVLGSYRDDEAPRLHEQCGRVDVLRLPRLDPIAMRKLVESMIGAAARRADVMALLERETEGIPFFIVEVVRALAESAGGLGHIGASRLPHRVISGGMQKVVRRRLDRVAKDALHALRTAAVIGRAIDPTLMQAVHPELVQEDWLMACAEAGVLEVRDAEWRFAHDKLREQVLDDLSAPARRPLHRRIAEAIEQEYPGSERYLTALAHHWQQAGDAAKEAEYGQRAGVLALHSGACQEAIVHLSRALELLQGLGATTQTSAGDGTPLRRPSLRARLLDPNARVDPDSAEFRLGMVEGSLTEAYFRLGDLAASSEHAERALRHFGQEPPILKLGWGVDVARQLTRRTLQVMLGARPDDAARSRRVATEVARVQNRFIEAAVYSLRPLPLLASCLRQVNHCTAVGPELELAQAYLILGGLSALVMGPQLLDRWCRRALAMVERTGSRRDVASVLSRVASQELSRCRWDTADAYLARAIESANDLGDLRLWAECHAQSGAVAHYSGRFERGLRLYADTHTLSRRGGNQQIQCWALLGQADLLLRLGRTEEALALYEEGIRKLDGNAMRSEAIWGFGMAALARLRVGDDAGAHEAADRAFSFIVRASPIAYWTQQGMAATAEVLLTLYEKTGKYDVERQRLLRSGSRRMCATLRTFSRRFPMGRPHAQLWNGLSAWLDGRPRRARRFWKRAIASAETLHTPLEGARAHLEMGRRLPLAPEDRRYYLNQAVQGFEKIGATYDLACARAALEEHAPSARA